MRARALAAVAVLLLHAGVVEAAPPRPGAGGVCVTPRGLVAASSGCVATDGAGLGRAMAPSPRCELTATRCPEWIGRAFGDDRAAVAQSLATDAAGATAVVGGAARDPDRGVYVPAVAAFSATDGRPLWHVSLDVSTADALVWDLAVTADGLCVVGVAVDVDIGTGVMTTFVLDARTGEVRWLTPLDGDVNDSTNGAWISLTQDDETAVVTGWATHAAGDTSIATGAFDVASGAIRWTHFWGTRGTYEAASDLSISDDGARAFIAGSTSGANASTQAVGSYDWAVLAYDIASGSLAWSATYDGGVGGSFDLAWSVVASADASAVYVGGYTQSDSEGLAWSSVDATVVSFDGATGATRWFHSYAGRSGGLNIAWGLAMSGDGTRVFAAGPGSGDTTDAQIDYSLRALDTVSGVSTWDRQLDFTPDDYPAVDALEVSADGKRLYVTGTTGSTLGFFAHVVGAVTTVAIDASSGIEAWTSHHSDSLALDPSVGAAVAVTPAGALVAATLGLVLDPTAGADNVGRGQHIGLLSFA